MKHRHCELHRPPPAPSLSMTLAQAQRIAELAQEQVGLMETLSKIDQELLSVFGGETEQQKWVPTIQ